MALRTNRLNAQGYIGGTAVGGAQAWSVKRLDLLRNLYVDNASAIDNKSGIPNGYNMGAILMPLKAGGMSSYNFAQLVLTATNADAKMGKALAGSSAMTLTLVNADLDQIVALIASGAASIIVDQANLSAGVLMIATASGSITVDVATLGGIIPVGASGTMTLTPDVDMSALAFMIAEAGGATPLSPEGLATSLLDSNDIETGYSMREALRLILSSAAGKLSGAETTTITIRNVTDDKSRIVATVDSNGNRTSVTYDVSE
jgi:hypothetical protein